MLTLTRLFLLALGYSIVKRQAAARINFQTTWRNIAWISSSFMPNHILRRQVRFFMWVNTTSWVRTAPRTGYSWIHSRYTYRSQSSGKMNTSLLRLPFLLSATYGVHKSMTPPHLAPAEERLFIKGLDIERAAPAFAIFTKVGHNLARVPVFSRTFRPEI